MAAAAAATLALAGCASVVGEKTQHILISTAPEGAACRVFRSGVVIGNVSSTPAAVDIRLSPVDLVVVCEKDGYQPTSRTNKADVAAASVVSALLWGGTGWAVDSATGTANRYDGDMLVVLAPDTSTSVTRKD